MTLEEKQQLYSEYLSDRARPIDVTLTGGPRITFQKSWDYKTTMKETTFKTLAPAKITHKSMKFEEVDLMPVANFKYYQITITK